MSIAGVTIDYGPFGFMDRYDPAHICNASGEPADRPADELIEDSTGGLQGVVCLSCVCVCLRVFVCLFMSMWTANIYYTLEYTNTDFAEKTSTPLLEAD